MDPNELFSYLKECHPDLNVRNFWNHQKLAASPNWNNMLLYNALSSVFPSPVFSIKREIVVFHEGRDLWFDAVVMWERPEGRRWLYVDLLDTRNQRQKDLTQKKMEWAETQSKGICWSVFLPRKKPSIFYQMKLELWKMKKEKKKIEVMK